MSRPVIAPLPERLRDAIDNLGVRFPCASPMSLRLAAFCLTSPATSSDALLLLADALDEASAAFRPGAAITLHTSRLTAHLRDEAPRFADAAEP